MATYGVKWTTPNLPVISTDKIETGSVNMSRLGSVDVTSLKSLQPCLNRTYRQTGAPVHNAAAPPTRDRVRYSMCKGPLLEPFPPRQANPGSGPHNQRALEMPSVGSQRGGGCFLSNPCRARIAAMPRGHNLVRLGRLRKALCTQEANFLRSTFHFQKGLKGGKPMPFQNSRCAARWNLP